MRYFFVLSFLSISVTGAFSQDTLRISPLMADSLLQKQSLSLVVYAYNIDVAKAQVIQSKLFENPVLNTEWSFYNPDKRKFFDVGGNGQKIISVEQVFKIAGQRNKAIKLATEQVKLTEYEYFDLVRSLKFQTRISLYSVYFLNLTLHNIDHQLRLLYETIQAYKNQYVKGNVSLKDYTRLQASYYELNSNRSEIINKRAEGLRTLQTLLGVDTEIEPVIRFNDIEKYRLDRIDLAVADSLSFYRPDIRAAEVLINVNHYNLQLQKSLRKPDLFVGGLYDQAGSYVNNYSAITAGVQIPIFNRNQGNIRMAEAQYKQASSLYDLKRLQAKNEWTAGFNKLVEIDAEFQKIDVDFVSQLDELNRNLISNYTKSNISLLEFTDLFEAYNDALIHINNLNIHRITAYEELNYITGKELMQ